MIEKPAEQKIHGQAYEIWESEGCSANPKNHRSTAERELNNAGTPQGQDAASAETPGDKIVNELGDFA